MKSCENCTYHKTYVNHKKMKELDIDSIIWYENCQHPHTPSEIKDMKIAQNCNYYDDEYWIK